MWNLRDETELAERPRAKQSPLNVGEMSRVQARWLGTLEKAGRWEGGVPSRWDWGAGPAPSGCLRPCYIPRRATAIGSHGYFDGNGRRAGKLIEQCLHPDSSGGRTQHV